MTGPDDQSESSDLCSFALQAGLAQLWRSWGIEPDIVLGFGVGQYSAACTAGVISFEDALTLVAERVQIVRAIKVQQELSSSPCDETGFAPEVKEALNRFESFADSIN